jgi:hypothetical protein
VPAFSITGFVFNLISLIVFLNPKLTGKLYKYFVTKSISELIFLAMGALYPLYFCTSCPTYGTLGWAAMVQYGAGIVIQTAFTYTGLCEIAIVYERLVVLYQIKRFDFKASTVIAVMFTVSCVPYIPGVFAKYIAQSTPGGPYARITTAFGSSLGYLLFQSLWQAITMTLIFCTVIALNIALVKKFKGYLAKKKSLVANARAARDILMNNTRPEIEMTGSII